MVFLVSKSIQGFKRVFLAALAFFAMLGLHNCGGPDTPTYECTPDITVPFPQDALDRFYFKTGTWWVYEEINNPGMEDSVWVTKNEVITEPPNPKIYGKINTRKCYSAYYVHIVNSRYGSLLIKMGISSPFDGFDYEKEFFGVGAIGELSNNIDLCIANLDGDSYREKNCDDNRISIDNSIMVQSQQYHEALHLLKDKGTWDYLDEAWYVRHIGLVKYKRADGSEWELVRYNIVQ